MANEDSEWQRDKHTSPYAVSKAEAELEVQRGIAEGLDAVIVNPCIVLGIGSPGRSSMTMVEHVRKGTRFFPPGSNSVVDARDVAAFSIALMDKGATGERHLLVGENLSYERLFTVITEGAGRPAPRYRIQPWMLELAWRLERVRTLFGGRPFITRHTAHSAVTPRSYDAGKAMRITGMRFRNASEAVKEVLSYRG
jgi:dihydroflavonol-4-reductase